MGWTAPYRSFQAPLLAPTRPESTVWPWALTTEYRAPGAGAGVIRYACLASPVTYPTWSSRTTPATAAPAGAAGAAAANNAPTATASSAATRRELAMAVLHTVVQLES